MKLRPFLIALTRDPISLLGTAITTASAMLIVSLILLEHFGQPGSPYIGILAYLVLPGFFLAGLLLIPVGIVRERRRSIRAAAAGEGTPRFPVIDLNQDRTRFKLLAFVLATAFNLILLAGVTYKGVETLDSTEFCGTTCHTVMQPEHTAYQDSPHARVKCVSCHIGPGAGWFVKSKLSGAWQVIAVAFDLYPRPIPTPIHNLRPARETCEQCHWPTKFVGDRLVVRTNYAEDKANTEQQTVLLLRVGGVEGRKSSGIHWHVDPNLSIRYLSDPSRETIYDVEMTTPDGEIRTYRPGDAPSADVETEWRVMDCVDCHNRPSHIYRMPGKAVDTAIREGRIARDLPFVRREIVRALTDDSYESHEAARAGIAERLSAYYTEQHPEIASERGAEIALAAEEAGTIFASNVFPEMKVEWGTYPNHIGHTEFEGCFRCHNDDHATEDGHVISQDCDTCHSLLAMEEENPAILAELNP